MFIKTCVALVLVAVGSGCLAGDAKPFSPDEMVDRIISAPGRYDQMCSIPPELKPGIPLPIYRNVLYTEVHLSKENIAELCAHRTGAVGVLQLRLAAMDVTKPALPFEKEMKFGNEENVLQSGIDPRKLSGLFMEMILSLDAVETLPELLRIESQYHGLITAAQADPKFKLPAMVIDGCYTEPAGKNVLSKRDKEILPFQLMQRQTFSLIMQLLRRQRFQPLLDSDPEKKYAAAIRARAAEKDLRDIKTPEDAVAQDKSWLSFDPIYNVPVGYIEDYPAMDFNAKLRDQMRDLAGQFVKTIPREQWKVNTD